MPTDAARLGREAAIELARSLLPSSELLADALVDKILAGEHAYLESTLLSREQLRSAVLENMTSILGQLGTPGPFDLSAARAAGIMKAKAGVPLPALLHAYRLAGRLIWEGMLAAATGDVIETLPHQASDVWDIIDHFSSAATDAYSAHVAERERWDADLRIGFLRGLLAGSLTDAAQLWDSMRALQLPENGNFLVVSAEVPESGATPLRRAEERLRSNEIHSVWTVESDAQIGLLSLPAGRREIDLPRILTDPLAGRVGVSLPFSSPLGAHAALRQAQLAARCMPAGEPGVVRYGTAPVPLLLVTFADAGRELVEEILGPVLRLPADESQALLATLWSWYEHGGSTSAAAKSLHCHRNTVYLRLRHIEELTGRSTSDPAAAAELYVALQGSKLLPGPVTPVAPPAPSVVRLPR